MTYRRGIQYALLFGALATVLHLPAAASAECATGSLYHTAFATSDAAWHGGDQTTGDGVLTLRARAKRDTTAILRGVSVRDASICATVAGGATGMQAGEAGIAYFFRGSGKNITYETFTTDSAGSFFVRTFEDGEWTQNLATHNAPDIVLGPGAKNDLLVVVHGTHVNYWINRKQVAALDDESGGDPPWQVGLYGSAPDSRPGQWTFTSFDVGK